MALTTSERGGLLIKAIAVLPPRAAFYTLRSVILALLWRMNIRKTIVCACIRAVFTTFSPQQIQHLVPSSRHCYQRFIRQKANQHPNGSLGVTFAEHVEPIDESGGALLWLGNRKKATKIVYFLHGGGFIVPLAPGHLRWCWDLYIKPSAAAGINVACAILEYTLSPESKYPGHLRQASSGLQAILDQGFSASDIIVGGDSAGGNLTMQLLMHIKHPHPDIPPVQIDAQLPAAFLVSAYLTFRSAHLPSFAKFVDVDLSPQKARLEELQIQVAGEGDPLPEMHTKYWWGTPLDASPDKYIGLGEVVRHIYVTFGDHEVLLEHSKMLIELLRKHAPEINLVVEVGHKEQHDSVLLEEMTRQPNGPGSVRMQRWFTRFLEGHYESQGESEKQKVLYESYTEL